jgi:hypothetical protein
MHYVYESSLAFDCAPVKIMHFFRAVNRQNNRNLPTCEFMSQEIVDEKPIGNETEGKMRTIADFLSKKVCPVRPCQDCPAIE